jgi:Leucine-rich repeat (LRR) protein
MANDLEIIKRLEKEIGGKLRMVELEKISGYNISGGYAVDIENRVIGLHLGEKKLSKIPQTLLKLSHLNVLNLWNNQIVDISPIKELQNLTHLDKTRDELA